MKILCHLILIINSILFLCSCEPNKDENTLIVGTSADNPPYEFMQNGEIVGFDIDLAKKIGEKLGKKIVIKNMEFHSLLASLSTNSVDMVVAGMSVTKDRSARVIFSTPYTSGTIAVLYRLEDNYQNHHDLKAISIGAQLGTIWALVAHDLAINCNCRVTSLSNNLVLVKELQTKRINAVIIEQSQAEKYVAMYPSLGSFPLTQYNSQFAIALPKDSTLKPKIDSIINGFKRDGTLEKLGDKWGVH